MTRTTISTAELKDRVERCHFLTYNCGGRLVHLAKPYPENFPTLCGKGVGNRGLKDCEFWPEYGHRMCRACVKASHILTDDEKVGAT